MYLFFKILLRDVGLLFSTIIARDRLADKQQTNERRRACEIILNFLLFMSRRWTQHNMEISTKYLSDLIDMKSKRPPTLSLYGKSIKRNILEGTCSGCGGKRDNSAKDEPVLLCDGIGCSREYHLGCTDPRLLEVPEGDYFCVDCGADGTTAQLEQYFDEADDDRSRFTSSKKYVESLVKKQMEIENDGDSNPRNDIVDEDISSKKRKHDSISSPSSMKVGIPPVSEVSRTEELHNTAMDDSRWRKNNKDSVPSPHATTIGRDFFIGKMIKLYCTTDNQYHTGRIIDWRSALPPGMELKNQFYGRGFIGATEFRVRFAAGMNGRKRTLLKWILFEEHSCAVSTSLVMALRDKGRGMNGWRAAQVMLRTCLELVPIRKLISNSDSSALVIFFGVDSSIYLDLDTDAVDVHSKPFHEEFKRKTASLPMKKPKNQVQYQLMALAMNALSIELQEQKRTLDWFSKPVNNFYHTKALTMIDEYSSELTLKDTDSDEAQELTDEGYPVPGLCPMIQQGLDKQWLSDRLAHVSNENSLDSMTTMKVRRSRLPACVATALINCSHRSS